MISGSEAVRRAEVEGGQIKALEQQCRLGGLGRCAQTAFGLHHPLASDLPSITLPPLPDTAIADL